MLGPEDFKKMKGQQWSEVIAKKAEEAKAMAKLASVLAPVEDCCFSEHPAETFDRLTRKGYKLDLVTGEYLPPALTRRISPRRTKPCG
jgi:hypothetical protein